ncbi:hypothetical protein [Anoxybacteroides rupiense]|jgi:hypothetical protein|uniref:hypothetical protein n=1 Tax=Anoxybacteroides rupiense TaxID=311460 RepID=UPI003671E5B7
MMKNANKAGIRAAFLEMNPHMNRMLILLTQRTRHHEGGEHVRMLITLFFSGTALSLLMYQLVEIVQAFMDLFDHHS